jgi:DNA-binding NtrC family response regulator
VRQSIFVVAHDRPLRETRVQLLQYAGFFVKSVETDDDAMAILETELDTRAVCLPFRLSS